MTVRRLDSLSAWTTGANDLRGAFLALGHEALWVSPGASIGDVAAVLRYFIGGLPQDLLCQAGAALRGEELPQKADGTPTPSLARLRKAVDGSGSVAVALRWGENLEAQISGSYNPGRLPEGRLSPVRQLHREPLELGDETLSICASESACPEPTFETNGLNPIRPALRSLTADLSPQRAEERALGEALERYAMGSVPHARLHRCAARELDGEYLDPSSVVSYTAPQRQRQRLSVFSPEEETWWIPGKQLDRPERWAWIPAALVFAPFPSVPAWTNGGIQSSNGAAYHPAKEEAIRNAWLELVERDAFLQVWRQALPSRKIPLSGLPPIARSVQAWIRTRDSQNRVITALLPSRTGIPVCVMIASGPEIGLCVGAGAAESVAKAACSAACECAVQVAFPAPAVASASDVAHPVDHAGYYRFDCRFRAANRMMETCRAAPDFIPRPAVPIAPRGYVVELDLPAPFPGHAVKVIDPALIPLTFGHDSEPLARHFLAARSLAEVDPDTHLSAPHPFA
jgi:hypothetical protein